MRLLPLIAAMALACGGRSAVSPDSQLDGACMPSVTIKQFAGLFTSPNPFSEVPEGAMSVADEIVATTPGEIEPRRGRKPSAQFTADRCFPLPVTGRLVTTVRTSNDPTLYDPATDIATPLTRSSGSSSQLPMLPPYASDARVSIQGAAAQGKVFLTTKAGIAVVPDVASPQWRSAGLPQPIMNFGAALAAGAATTMANNKRRTYRCTIGWYDELGNFLESAPSEPYNYDNTAGFNVAPVVNVGYPLGAPAGIILRLYRALEVPTGTVSADEMFLVTQMTTPQAVGAPNNFIDMNSVSFQAITDQSADSLLTIPLYTNPRTGDGFGIGGANFPPPAGAAIAFFKGRLYVGRTTGRQSIQIQIIGTGPGGVQDGDIITIGGVPYIGNGFDGAANGSFTVVSGGGVAGNIESTARNLTGTLESSWRRPDKPTLFSSNIQRQFRAHYVSLGSSDFGRILIERIFSSPLTDDPGIGFSVQTASPGISFPNGVRTSTDNYTPGGVAWSKYNQPEAFPLINFQAVGDPNAAVLGFSVHRDSLFMYKEDGVWLVKDDGGPQPTFSLLDASVNVIAPSSIAVLDNVAYCLTARGPLQVSEQGTWPVGEAIRADIVKLINASPNKCANAYGVGYDSDRLYVLGMPSAAGEGACSVQYILRVPDVNSPPRWTRWLLPGTTHGCVIPVTNKLALAYGTQPIGNNVLGAPTGGVLVERKGGVVSTDYVDYIGNVACPAFTTASKLVFPQDVHLEIQRGDKFWYNPGGAGTKVYEITVTAVAGATVTLDGTYPFAGGTLTYLRAIQSRLRLLPITGGEPTSEKQWNYVQAYFDYFDGDSIDMKVDSENSPLAGFSAVYSDPRNGNLGGQIQGTFPGAVAGQPSPATPCGQIQWLRNCRDVLMRCDPGRDESRSARLGVEMLFAQARSSFRLAAVSAWIGSADEVGGR